MAWIDNPRVAKVGTYIDVPIAKMIPLVSFTGERLVTNASTTFSLTRMIVPSGKTLIVRRLIIRNDANYSVTGYLHNVTDGVDVASVSLGFGPATAINELSEPFPTVSEGKELCIKQYSAGGPVGAVTRVEYELE